MKTLLPKFIIKRLDGRPISPNDKYIVLQIDGNGDALHIEAARAALKTYKEYLNDHIEFIIPDHLNKLQNDRKI